MTVTTSHTAEQRKQRTKRMTKKVYTIATADLILLDGTNLTTLEAAEEVRDKMSQIFNREYFVVNIKTFNSKE